MRVGIVWSPEQALRKPMGYIISSSPDYPLMVYNNNFPMHGPPVHHHHPHHMMDNGFYASPDSMYNGTPNGMPPPGGYDAM